MTGDDPLPSTDERVVASASSVRQTPAMGGGRSSHRHLAAVLGGFVFIGLVASGTEARADLLPDLEMAPLEDFWVEESPVGGQFLRFAASMVNTGSGPFELRGARASVEAGTMEITQVVDELTGGSRRLSVASVMAFAGDGHMHWHAQRVMSYELWSANGDHRRTMKTGFCFWDGHPAGRDVPGSPPAQVYQARTCGGPEALANEMGLSVGWRDSYPSHLPWQWIEVTGLPPGTYVVSARADAAGDYLESDRDNNCASATVQLDGGGEVRVLDHGAVCAPAIGLLVDAPVPPTAALVPFCQATPGLNEMPDSVRLTAEAICHLIMPPGGH